MAEAIDIRELNIRIEQQSGFVTNLVAGMDRVIVGQKHLVDSLLISLLSDGHILLEGVPGLAKNKNSIATNRCSLQPYTVYPRFASCGCCGNDDLFAERRKVSSKKRAGVCQLRVG